MARDTAAFLRAMNERNAVIAAREAKPPEVDQIRIDREQERREKWGPLRAREHPSRRKNTGQVRSVFPYVNP